VRRAAAFLLCSLGLAACGGAEEQGVILAHRDDPVIVLSEGPCPEDTCPVYDLTLRPDGSYILNGTQFVRTIGVTEGSVDPEAWTDASKVLEGARFWSLQTNQTSATLPNCHSGTPSVKVTWRLPEGKQKTLTYEAGCGVQATTLLVSQLRDAMHFQDLVWTNERFQFEGPGPR